MCIAVPTCTNFINTPKIKTMKTILTPIKSIRILVFFLLLFICTVQLNNKLYAQAIGITINGQVSGSIIQQGGYIHWIITGL